jgi:long-subunit fatty acid transport protein
MMIKQVTLTALGAAACALLLSVPATAAEKSATSAHKTSKMAAKKARSAWPAESLSGKIAMVNTAAHRVVVMDASGTPFDMIVTPSTRIRSGDRSLKLNDLASRTNKGASVHFVPQRNGDVAKSIQLIG